MLVYDIQDVGCRFYTYISTLGQCMEAAARKKIPFIVLDRLNLLGGEAVEGPSLKSEFRSFVGAFPIPIRYGLTPGELAGFIKDTQKLDVALAVVKLKTGVAASGMTRQVWSGSRHHPTFRHLKRR